MLPTDPKKAADLGKAWGNVLADSIFGITDTLRDGKGMKAAANKNMEMQNKMMAIKNKSVQAKNFVKQKEMERNAADQEAAMLARMSPADREEYHKMRAEEAKASARAKKEEEERAQEMKDLAAIGAVVVIVLPLIAWGLLFMFGVIAKTSGDYSTFHMLQKFVPGL